MIFSISSDIDKMSNAFGGIRSLAAYVMDISCCYGTHISPLLTPKRKLMLIVPELNFGRWYPFVSKNS